MAYKQVDVEIRGVAPLLLHNGQLADPSNPYAKALKVETSKRNKTDDVYEEMTRIEWEGSLYLRNGRIVIPGENLESLLSEAAKKMKKRKEFQAGLLIDGDWPLGYKGPQNYKDLWKAGKNFDRRRVRVGTNAVQRTRPRFDEWSLDFTVQYNAEVLNLDVVVEAIHFAGAYVGLGDYKPRYGRFEVLSTTGAGDTRKSSRKSA